MGVVKLKNEKKIITFFLITTLVVFVLSAIFLFSSIKKDELGGSFITAMLLFISGYGIIVFILRAVRYTFITKLQKAVLNDGIKDVQLLSEHFGKSNEKIEKELHFLIDNGYLGEYEIVGDRLINPEEERIMREKMREEMIKAEINEKENKEQQKQESKKQPKRGIVSEKCPNCGAKVKFSEGEATCPYCGNILRKA